MAFEGFHVEIVGPSRHDEEGNHRLLAVVDLRRREAGGSGSRAGRLRPSTLFHRPRPSGRCHAPSCQGGSLSPPPWVSVPASYALIFLVLSLCPGSPGRPYSEQIVEPGQGLQEDVGSLVGELVAAGDKEVQGLVQVEVQVPREATQGWVRLRPSPSSSGLETTNPRNSRGKKDHRQSGGHMETPGICGLMLSWGIAFNTQLLFWHSENQEAEPPTRPLS